MKALLTGVGFDKDNRAWFQYNLDGYLTKRHWQFGEDLNLRFDTQQRFCTGWKDLKTGEDHPCPNHQKLEPRYSQCAACQAKTGFNPAFYHADSVSEVQQELNSKPHFLYLAYFGPEQIKVGISHAGRGQVRLYEQGARLAYILETFSSALIARQYEAKIAAADGFLENVKSNLKMSLLKLPFERDQALAKLKAAKEQAELVCKTRFGEAELIEPNQSFFTDDFDSSSLDGVIDFCDQKKISGRLAGVIGDILICRYQDSLLALPIKQFLGYQFDLTSELAEDLELPSQQVSLF